MYNNNEQNDDDDFFVPPASSSSNLAHLFAPASVGSLPHQDNPTTLTYTPPKQPQVANLQQTNPPQKKLVCVKTITLNQVLGTTTTNIGKFGLAIIADTISADLILYKTKQNILSSSKLSTTFHFKQVNDLSITYTDDQSIVYLVIFESPKDIVDFTLELTKQGAKKQAYQQEHSQKMDNLSTRLIAEKPEEEQKRADILGRMSKLGMSILPSTETLNSSRSEVQSESEPEEVIRTTKVRKVRGRHSESAVETMDLVSKPTFSSFPNVQHVTLGHQLMDPMNIYLAENRTHNSEVRMNLSQLGSKIDTLLSELRPQSSLRSPLNGDYLERRIIELERKLEQQTLPSSSSKEEVQELERKLDDKIKENSGNVIKYEDIITTLKLEVETLQNSLESERSSSKTKLDQIQEQCLSLEEEKQSLKSQISELESLVENQKLKLDDFSAVYKQEQENKLDRLAREAAEKELKQTAEYLQNSLDESNKRIEELELLYQQAVESRCKDEDVFADLVKEAMNVMYQNVLTDSIDSTSNIDVRDLKKILQKHLKGTTFSIINQFQTVAKRASNSSTTQIASVSPEFEVTV